METAKYARTGAKRPTIAFFVAQIEGDYCEELCKGIIDAAEEHDVNLIVFPGWPLKYNIGNQSNHNVIYEYVSSGAHGPNVDALVVSSLVLYGHISSQEFKAFVSRYHPIPVVSIGVPIEGIPSVLTNNRPGFKQLLNHLIHHHHKRRIAFIKGLEGHIDSGQRFSVYREVLRENGLEYDPDLVAPGDFIEESAEIAMKLFDERKVHYDAIAVANDMMAFGVLKALRERNIRVPDQVAVTGFDNGEGAKQSSPTLTTVRQPIYEQSKQALEMALELIQGKQPDSVVLDTEMVIRESCGCLSETLQTLGTHSADYYQGEAMDGNDKLEVIVDRFIIENLGKITGKVAKYSMIKSFITSCFEIFARNELKPSEVDGLFRGFKSLIDVPDLEENDIVVIQKAITSLNQWIHTGAEDLHMPARNDLLVEDFFQKLRVFITDMAVKMQGRRVISYHDEIYQLRDILVEMVLRIDDYHEHLPAITPWLHAAGINNCYYFLYDRPVRYSQNEVWPRPATVNLALGYNGENWSLEKSGIAQECAKRLPWEKVICNEFLPQSKRYTLMLKPFFVEDEHLGLILIEFNMDHGRMFESLIIEMSCALKLSLLFHEREQIDHRLQEVVQELEEYNRKLKNVSQTDELTGLYNRRGFFNFATQRLDQARQQKKNGLLFFADMDGLKKINDEYGHEEGDFAIRAMAKILIKIFATIDIIARFGGDEFAILAVDSGLAIFPEMKERLRKHTEEYNLQSGKPYPISITMGVAPFDNSRSSVDERVGERVGAPLTLEELISQADQLMYEEKQRKKEV